MMVGCRGWTASPPSRRRDGRAVLVLRPKAPSVLPVVIMMLLSITLFVVACADGKGLRPPLPPVSDIPALRSISSVDHGLNGRQPRISAGLVEAEAGRLGGFSLPRAGVPTSTLSPLDSESSSSLCQPLPFSSVVGNISFPRDAGNHPMQNVEWWYVLGTAQEVDEEGRPLPGGSSYGLLFNLIRSSPLCLPSLEDMVVELDVIVANFSSGQHWTATVRRLKALDPDISVSPPGAPFSLVVPNTLFASASSIAYNLSMADPTSPEAGSTMSSAMTLGAPLGGKPSLGGYAGCDVDMSDPEYCLSGHLTSIRMPISGHFTIGGPGSPSVHVAGHAMQQHMWQTVGPHATTLQHQPQASAGTSATTLGQGEPSGPASLARRLSEAERQSRGRRGLGVQPEEGLQPRGPGSMIPLLHTSPLGKAGVSVPRHRPSFQTPAAIAHDDHRQSVSGNSRLTQAAIDPSMYSHTWDWFYGDVVSSNGTAFGLQFTNDHFQPDGSHSTLGNVYGPDGVSSNTTHWITTFEASWTSPFSGLTYPTKARIQNPSFQIDLQYQTFIQDDEFRAHPESFVYYEGFSKVVGVFWGVEVTGWGNLAHMWSRTSK